MLIAQQTLIFRWKERQFFRWKEHRFLQLCIRGRNCGCENTFQMFQPVQDQALLHVQNWRSSPRIRTSSYTSCMSVQLCLVVWISFRLATSLRTKSMIVFSSIDGSFEFHRHSGVKFQNRINWQTIIFLIFFILIW